MTANLPYEIIKEVFSNLYKSDIIECQTMCRAWYTPASEILNKEFCFYRDNEIKKFNYFLASQEKSLGRTIGVHVKRLFLTASNLSGCDSSDFLDLLHYCPNVETLSIAPLLASLLKSLGTDRAPPLLKLQEIDCQSADFSQELFQIVLKYKETIKSVSLFLKDASIAAQHLQALSEFRQLAQLNVRNDLESERDALYRLLNLDKPTFEVYYIDKTVCSMPRSYVDFDEVTANQKLWRVLLELNNMSKDLIAYILKRVPKTCFIDIVFLSCLLSVSSTADTCGLSEIVSLCHHFEDLGISFQLSPYDEYSDDESSDDEEDIFSDRAQFPVLDKYTKLIEALQPDNVSVIITEDQDCEGVHIRKLQNTHLFYTFANQNVHFIDELYEKLGRHITQLEFAAYQFEEYDYLVDFMEALILCPNVNKLDITIDTTSYYEGIIIECPIQTAEGLSFDLVVDFSIAGMALCDDSINCIFQNFPKLEKLQFGGCDFEREGETENVLIDLSAGEMLKHFSIDMLELNKRIRDTHINVLFFVINNGSHVYRYDNNEATDRILDVKEYPHLYETKMTGDTSNNTIFIEIVTGEMVEQIDIFIEGISSIPDASIKLL